MFFPIGEVPKETRETLRSQNETILEFFMLEEPEKTGGLFEYCKQLTDNLHFRCAVCKFPIDKAIICGALIQINFCPYCGRRLVIASYG